jgi:CheY-like chemotaxis protein
MAADGREALELWRTGDFGLLLTDLHMPVMDGYALAMSIRAEEVTAGRRRTPIIALTANAWLEEERRCFAAGMDAYLSKPAPLATLKTLIDAWLADAPVSTPPTLPVSAPDAAPAPVDLAVLRAMIGDDPANMNFVLRSFRQSAAVSQRELSHPPTGATGGAIADTAHKFKSAARSVGAMRLGDLCAQIEQAAASPSSEELAVLMPLCLAEADAVFRYVDAHLVEASKSDLT